MRRPRSFALSAVAAATLVVAWVAYGRATEHPRLVTVESPTLLWPTELTASRQLDNPAGSAKPLRALAAGEVLQVISSTYGKDYWALEVRAGREQAGWVLGAGQVGIHVVP